MEVMALGRILLIGRLTLAAGPSIAELRSNSLLEGFLRNSGEGLVFHVLLWGSVGYNPCIIIKKSGMKATSSYDIVGMQGEMCNDNQHNNGICNCDCRRSCKTQWKDGPLD